MKNLSILGSTGSIGVNTLSVIDKIPSEFKIKGLTTGKNIKLLEKQIRKYKPEVVAVFNTNDAMKLKKQIGNIKCEILTGIKGIEEVATLSSINLVVCALSGTIGLIPTLEAIKKNKDIALANKEILVIAGKIIMEEVKKREIMFFPIDSEHSAIFQCLNKEEKTKVKKIILTASGGPFLNYSLEKIKSVTVEDALKHPVWKMGKKITIDSATLLNKGLEVIEAHFLFDIDFDKIEVLIHPESIIHSLVEFVDHSILAQMSVPDMKLPIQYALNFGKRIPSLIKSLDLTKIKTLNFRKPNPQKFPCLKYSYEAGKIGGTMPIILNASAEEAVNLFIRKKIGFVDIHKIIRKIMENHKVSYNPTIEEILMIDKCTREAIKRSF